jgi:iron complex transport system ATP-binding protein
VGEGEGLVLERVTAGYRARSGPPVRPALSEVTLRAGPGEVAGLIGPNGSGKTTLVRVASRGLAPSSGSVRVCGVDPYSIPVREAARLVSVVPQELAPVFAYSVHEIVSMGRSPHLSPWGGGGSQDWAAVRRAMEAADVDTLADRSFSELSGGERQRAVVAQALAQEAPVLLLDEPTAHLDPRHLLDVLALVRGLARTRDTAVLAIFHDLNLASAFCDRIYALFEGRVVAAGSPNEVITGDLLSEVYGVEADVTPDPATGRPVVVIGPGLHGEAVTTGRARVHVIGGAGRGAAVMRALAERGLEVTAGVLHATDTDATVAARLGLLRVTVPPFSLIDERSAAECLELAGGAAALVVCDAPFGQANVENLRIALGAGAHGVPLYLLEETPMRERDFTGGGASELWEALRAAAVVSARSTPELLAALESFA